jgi:hypothetical protein
MVALVGNTDAGYVAARAANRKYVVAKRNNGRELGADLLVAIPRWGSGGRVEDTSAR